MVAKHGRKKNYCSVCRTDYEDYLVVLPITSSIFRTTRIGSSSGPTSSANTYSRPSSASACSPAPQRPSSPSSRPSSSTRPTSRRRLPSTWLYRLTDDVFTTFFMLTHTYHRLSPSTNNDSKARPLLSRTPAPPAVHSVKWPPACQKESTVARRRAMRSLTACSGRRLLEDYILRRASNRIL